MLRNGLAKKLPKVFQWMQVLNRWIFQTTKLVELEHEYDYVIFDRWSCSSMVYGSAEGIETSLLEKMTRLLRAPDFTIVLLGNSHKHEPEDDYEKDASLQTRVSDLYAEWVDKNARKAHVVDCERSKEKVSSEIITVLKIMRVIPV
jgi:thymidylate kinase